MVIKDLYPFSQRKFSRENELGQNIGYGTYILK
jgi:hypothetical protein